MTGWSSGCTGEVRNDTTAKSIPKKAQPTCSMSVQQVLGPVYALALEPRRARYRSDGARTCHWRGRMGSVTVGRGEVLASRNGTIMLMGPCDTTVKPCIARAARKI